MLVHRLTFPLLAIAALAFAACDGGTEYIVVDNTQDGRPVGEGCVTPSDCESGRCIGGVCSDDLCTDDTACLTSEVCIYGQCVPATEFACSGDEAPLLGLAPLNVSFGEVALGNSGQQTVTLENKGDCLLNINDVYIDPNGDTGFRCIDCDPTTFPRKIAPQRSLDFTIEYSPAAPGEALSALFVRSDDATAGQNGLVSVELHGTYSGIPNLVIEPSDLHFGYVPQGGSATEDVVIRNYGSGNAVVTIEAVYVLGTVGGNDFSIPPESQIRPTAPLSLPPYNPDDDDTELVIPVTFAPESITDFAGELLIQFHYGDAVGAQDISVPLSGSSKGPPSITVNPTQLVFQADDGTALPVGMVAYRQVTIANNQGQSDLVVDVSLQDPTGDFSLSPAFVPPIAPGGSVVLSVFYNPSEPSDAVNPHDPQVPVDAFLNITSNDTSPASDVLKVVSLKGWAKGGTFDDILKVEMEYENADNSWAGNDYRNVDLELISGVGLSCTKPIPQYVQDPNGNYIINETVDLCDQWNDYGQLGTASWIALGQYEEPERILLYGLGQDLADGQLFTLRVHYMEDCANIPTGILADVLGITGSILLGMLGGSIGVPITVPPDQISDLVSENCWDHASSNVTAHVFLNGVEVAAPSVRLQEKGDYFDIAKLRRENGQFVLLP